MSNEGQKTNGAPVGDPESGQLEMSQTLLGSEPLGRTLDRIARLATTAVPGIDEVSVTLVDETRPRTVVFTGDLAVHLDERQYEDGFGPCLEAAYTGQTVEMPDTSAATRFEGFARQAARSGVTRLLSVGMPVPGRTVGAMNLYARSGYGFDAQTLAAAEAFAVRAAVVASNAATYARTAEQVTQMREAMASRAVIEQAKGMIMAAQHVTADEAFAVLSRLAARTDRKVRVVAADIVEGHGRGL